MNTEAMEKQKVTSGARRDFQSEQTLSKEGLLASKYDPILVTRQ